MTQLLGVIATMCACLFAGAALYITLVEHPVRSHLDTAAAVMQWAPSYRRATLLQAPLAAISCLTAIAAWFAGGDAGWLVAAVLIGAVIPFTLIIVMPTNRSLLAADRDTHSAATRALLNRWGSLHAVRTVVSLVAMLLMFWLLALSEVMQ